MNMSWQQVSSDGVIQVYDTRKLGSSSSSSSSPVTLKIDHAGETSLGEHYGHAVVPVIQLYLHMVMMTPCCAYGTLPQMILSSSSIVVIGEESSILTGTRTAHGPSRACLMMVSWVEDTAGVENFGFCSLK